MQIQKTIKQFLDEKTVYICNCPTEQGSYIKLPRIAKTLDQ